MCALQCGMWWDHLFIRATSWAPAGWKRCSGRQPVRRGGGHRSRLARCWTKRLYRKPDRGFVRFRVKMRAMDASGAGEGAGMCFTARCSSGRVRRRHALMWGEDVRAAKKSHNIGFTPSPKGATSDRVCTGRRPPALSYRPGSGARSPYAKADREGWHQRPWCGIKLMIAYRYAQGRRGRGSASRSKYVSTRSGRDRGGTEAGCAPGR